MAGHWVAVDRETLGAWLLRASPGGFTTPQGRRGFTGRANSALAVGDPGRDVTDALAAVTDWYAARGLTPQLSLSSAAGGSGDPDACRAETLAEDRLRAALPAAGWRLRHGGGALVLTATTAGLVGPTAHVDLPGGSGLRLDLADEPDAGWLATYRYRGEALPAQARALLMSAPDQAFVSVRDGATTAAVGRGSLGGGWAGVTAVEVSPAYRRRGLGRAVLAAIAGWALPRGGASTYLQVSPDNAPALALYRSAGFTAHHRYDYYEVPRVPA